MLTNIPIERNENGFWMHPDLRKYQQGQVMAEVVDMEIVYVAFDEDPNVSEELNDKYFDEGSPDISGWNPTPPPGDNWYCAYIMDDYDHGCPVAMFVRPV